jgi:uncharacterized membrane protein YfcA
VTLGSVFLLVALAVGASALGGALGMASGIFIVPLLTTFAHVSIEVAIGASLISVIACSCASAPGLLRAGLTNVRLAVVLEVATTLGALLGVALSGALTVPVLYGLFAAVLLASAVQMLTRRTDRRAADVSAIGDLGRSRLSAGMALMFGAGALSALLGIGSGVLKIPAMDGALRLPIKVSSATANFTIGVTAAAGASAYLLRGDVRTTVAAPVAIGSVVGSILGARALIGLPPERLRAAFIVVLILLSVQMTLTAAGLGGV